MDRSAIKRLANSAGRREKRKADKLLRLSKALKTGGIIKTGTGRISRVLKLNDKFILIRADKGNKEVIVPKEKVRKMLSYFIMVRIVERKELEVFHSHSSLMFGILLAVYRNNVKINKVGILLRLVIKGLRVFLAGAEKSVFELKVAVKGKANHLLYSYYYIRKGNAWRRRLGEYNLKCLLDCGKFSQWQKNTNELCIDAYIQFIKDNNELIQHYFVYDELGDHNKTMENLKYMERKGLTPIPIFHMGSPFFFWINWFKKDILL